MIQTLGIIFNPPMITYNHTYNDSRQYTPARETITIDFSSIGGSTLYDIKPSASVSFVEEDKNQS